MATVAPVALIRGPAAPRCRGRLRATHQPGAGRKRPPLRGWIDQLSRRSRWQLDRVLRALSCRCRVGVGGAWRNSSRHAGALAPGGRRPRRGSATDKLITALSRRPIIDVNSTTELVGVSYPQAREAVLALEAAGVLKQVNVGRRRNRAWEATEMIALLDDFEFESATPTRDDEPRRPPPPRRR